MKFSIFPILLLCAIFNINAQETKVDSAQSQIEAYFNLDISDSLRAVYKAQIDHMNKYIAQDSVNSKAFLQRGIYYAQLGLQVEAISDYDKSIALNDQEPIAFFNRGLAKSRFKFTYEGCYDFKKSAQLGLEQGATVFDENCSLFKKTIQSELVQQ